MDRKSVEIGDTYHQWTKYRRGQMAGGGVDWANQPSPYKEFPAPLKRIPIVPPSRKDRNPLWEAIGKRRSIRDFSHQPIALEAFSRLIWATQGVTARTHGFEFRAAPSAGALYPIETYPVVNRVEGVPAGIYHYSVKESQILLIQEGSFGQALSHAALSQGMLADAACIFVWTAVVERSKWKYRERAYRYIYMDAGHLGQNLYLTATGLGLGCCTVGAFFDEEIDRLIGIDGEKEISVYLGAVGPVSMKG